MTRQEFHHDREAVPTLFLPRCPIGKLVTVRRAPRSWKRNKHVDIWRLVRLLVAVVAAPRAVQLRSLVHSFINGVARVFKTCRPRAQPDPVGPLPVRVEQIRGPDLAERGRGCGVLPALRPEAFAQLGPHDRCAQRRMWTESNQGLDLGGLGGLSFHLTGMSSLFRLA